MRTWALAVLVAVLAAAAAAAFYVHSRTGAAQRAGTATAPPAQQPLPKPPRGLYLVVIGDPRCPHCRAMEAFLRSTGFVKSYFCPIENKVCGSAFYKLYKMKATFGVPTIAACVPGRLLFIEIGSFKNERWWVETALRLYREKPGPTIPVYIGSQLYKRIPYSESLYQLLCNTTLPASQLISPGPAVNATSTAAGGR